jgi:hypothetical protein
MEKITRNDVLKEMNDMAWHNVLCYSANYAMTKPKAGSEAEWERAWAKAEIVDQMVKELPVRHDDRQTRCTSYPRTFVGRVNGWRCGADADGKPGDGTMEFSIENVGFILVDGDTRLFRLNDKCRDYLFNGRYKDDLQVRCDKGKGNLMRITANGVKCVQMEWAD